MLSVQPQEACVKVGNVLKMFLGVRNGACFLNEFSLTSMAIESNDLLSFFKKTPLLAPSLTNAGSFHVL